MANREVIADLVARVTMDGTKFQDGMGKVSRELNRVKAELDTTRKRFQGMGDSQEALRRRSQGLSEQLRLQQARVEILSKAYLESRNNSGEYSKQTQNLATRLERARGELALTEEQLKQVNEQLRLQQNSFYVAGQNLKSFGTSLQTFGQHARQFGNMWTIGITAPILATGGSVFKAAMDFESAFAGVRKTVDATEEEFAQFRHEIRELAKDIPLTANEIAEIAETAGQLGIQNDAIMSFTRTMADLGVATNMTSEQAATALARLANITQMSQQDFDRLGSTVVDLGNNLATTEAEIVEMGLRLAGAGNQIGLTEAQILSFAGALSSVGVRAEAGGTAFSRVFLNINTAVMDAAEELQAFAKVANMTSDEFKQLFERDASLALLAFIEGLAKLSDEGANTAKVLADLGLGEIRVRDALMRAAGASNVFRESLEIGNRAWEENVALTEEAEERYKTTESRLKIMWNRIKDVAIELGEALVPAVMSAIDAAEPFIKQLESAAKRFSELSEEEQRSTLKTIAFIAAIGPAANILGNTTIAIGGLSRGLGGLFTLIGRSGGTGLLGRMTMLLGRAGPIGLGISLVGLLGGAIWGLTRNKQELHDVNLDLIKQTTEEVQATDNLINEFERLQRKNRLTSEQMLEYMDILSDLEKTSAPEVIAELTSRKDDLLRKSGFTNEEMEHFIELNNNIIDRAPDVEKAISSEGNAYAENLKALKELNEEKRRDLLYDTEQELVKILENQVSLMQDEKRLAQELEQIYKDIDQNKVDQLAKEREIEKQRAKVRSIEEEINALVGATSQEAIQQRIILEEQKRIEEEILIQLNHEHTQLEKNYDNLNKQRKTKIDNLETTREELKKTDELIYKYEQIVLMQAGITAEKGKGLDAINEQIRQLERQRRQAKELYDRGVSTSQEYQEQVAHIDEQIKRLNIAKGQLEDINEIAGRTIYNKQVFLTVPNLAEIEKRIGKPIAKRVTLDVNQQGAIYAPLYADGTNYHPGGPFIAGEEGPELAKFGNKWALLTGGLYDGPKGTKVFTAKETQRMLSGVIGSIPAYANGARTAHDVSNLVNQNNMSNVETLLQQLIYAVKEGKNIVLNGHVVGREITPYVTEEQERTNRFKGAFA